MNGREAIKELVNRHGESMRSLSLGLGKAHNFVYTTTLKEHTHVETLATIARACDHTLALVPDTETLPAGSIVID